MPTGFLKYALTTVVRNRRRTFSAIIGIVLAVTFIAGGNIAIDSTTRTLLQRTLQGVDVDFVAHAYNSNSGVSTAAVAALKGVDGVTNVEPVVQLSLAYNYSTAGVYNKAYGTVFAVQPSYRSFLNSWQLQGEFTVAPGRVVLTKNLADQGGVAVGDRVNLTYETGRVVGPIYTIETTSISLLLEGILVPLQDFTGGLNGVSPGFPFQASYIGLPNLPQYLQDLNATNASRDTSYYILVDRDRFIDPYDSMTTQERLGALEAELRDVASLYGLSVDNRLSGHLSTFYTALTFQRLFFVAGAIPLILLGWYLGRVGTELGMAERRRELGIWKARGAGSGQVFALLLVEALLLGLLAGILGLVAGVLASRFLLQTAALGASNVDYLALALSPTTVAITVIAAAILTFIASFRASRRSARLPVADALQFYSPGETSIAYRPTLDIVMLTLAIADYIFVLYSNVFRGQFSFLLFLAGIIFVVLIPFSPIFLIVGLTRLLTQATHRIYGWAALAVKYLTGELWPLVQKNLARNPRRASSVCVIMALGLAFGIFITATYGTQLAYEERQLKATVGSDLQILGVRNAPVAMATVKGMEGVEGVAPYLPTYGSSGGVIVFDAASYHSVVNPEGYFFTQGYPDALDRVKEPNTAVVTKAFATNNYLAVGRHFSLSLNYGNLSGALRLEVVGVAKAMPGMFGVGEVFIDHATFGLTSEQFLALGGEFSAMGFLVKAKTGVDTLALGARVRAALPGSSVVVYEEQLEQQRANPVRGAFLGFFLVQIGFAVLILTIGLGLILYAATLERENEFAGIAARGASTAQVSTILLGEAVALMIIGSSIGVGTGLLTAYTFNQLITSGGGEVLLDRPLVVPLETVLLVAGALGSMALVSFLVSLRIRFMPLARVLRIRGG